MFKWSAFPFIRVSFFLIIGILAREEYPLLWQNHLYLAGTFFFVFLISWGFLRIRLVHSLITFAFIGYLGGLLAHLNDDRLNPDHYSHFYAEGFTATVISDATEKKNYNRYKVGFHQIKTAEGISEVSGDLYLYVRKDSGALVLDYGSVLAVKNNYFEVGSPKNPHEFDYKAYLETKNIFGHAFANADEIRIIDYDPSNILFKWAYGVRKYAGGLLQQYITMDRERAILSALLLGIKDQLDNELKEAYASAGAMHVLAVSGLHVGIIYYILLILFRPLRNKKAGRFLFVSVSLSVIWMYALITGFSPSVMRAATMFSVVIVSEAFNRKANIYNSLGIAAFLLILYDPYMIYSVGFQLSFVAVFGIVILHPWLYRKYEARTKAGDYIWSITCVSIVAQLATFPLALYYFNQFPTYFLVSNLLVIPAALLSLSAGLLMLTLGALSSTLGSFLGFLLQWFIWGVNEGIGLLKVLPYPLFDWLYIDKAEVLLIYAIMGLLIYAFGRQSFSALAGAFLCFIGFSVLGLKTEFESHTQKKIVFYEIDDNVAIDLVNGRNAQLLLAKSGEDLEEVLHYQIDPNRIANGLPKAEDTWGRFDRSGLVKNIDYFDLICWQGYRILVANEVPSGSFEGQLKADIVYLTAPWWKSLKWLDTRVLLLGTELSYYEIDDLREVMEAKGVKVHSLTQDGFWELDLNNTTL